MKILRKEKSSKVLDFEAVKVAKEEKKAQINSAVEEYYNLTQQENTIKSRKKELSDLIKNYALANGSKDDKGSYYCDNDKFVFGRQASISVVEKEDIIDRLTEMGFEDCIKTVKVVDRDKLDSYHDKGDISDSDLRELFMTKENTPRVYVKLKEVEAEMPEVQQKKVARRKGRK